MTLRKTFHTIKTDYAAAAYLMQIKPGWKGRLFLFFTPSVVAVTLYRISRYFYVKKIKALAWFFWILNIYVTQADIVPSSDIGESFCIGHPGGTVIAAKLGSNVMVAGQAGIGGNLKKDDIGAGPGLPVLGNNVFVGFRAVILGPIHVGDNAKIAAMTFVTKPVPESATAAGNPCRVLGATHEMA